MNEMRNSFNRTSTRLTKVESQNRDVNETLKEIVEMISFLYKEINRLDVAYEKTILCARIRRLRPRRPSQRSYWLLNLLGLVNAFCKPDISVMIGFQIIILLLWCRPRRDRQLAKQLAKIEIQLDLIQSKLSAKHEKQKAGRRYTMDFASPDRPTTKKGQKGSKKSHRAITEQINENVDNVFIES